MIQTVSEFAKRLGCKRETIYTYGKRGKIIIIGGKIDDENGTNMVFLSTRNNVSDESGSVVLKATQKESTCNTETEVNEYASLSQAKLKKAIEDAKFAKLRNEKISGKLVSTDVVGRFTQEVIMRYKSAFVQQTDQLLRDTLNSLGVENSILTSTLSRLTDIANEASSRAVMEAKFAVENSISDSLSLIK